MTDPIWLVFVAFLLPAWLYLAVYAAVRAYGKAHLDNYADLQVLQERMIGRSEQKVFTNNESRN